MTTWRPEQIGGDATGTTEVLVRVEVGTVADVLPGHGGDQDEREHGHAEATDHPGPASGRVGSAVRPRSTATAGAMVPTMAPATSTWTPADHRGREQHVQRGPVPRTHSKSPRSRGADPPPAPPRPPRRAPPPAKTRKTSSATAHGTGLSRGLRGVARGPCRSVSGPNSSARASKLEMPASSSRTCSTGLDTEAQPAGEEVRPSRRAADRHDARRDCASDEGRCRRAPIPGPRRGGFSRRRGQIGTSDPRRICRFTQPTRGHARHG